MSARDRLGVIILAAGVGRRLGRDKATLPWGAATLLEHVIGQFPAERVGRCVVVAGPRNQADVRRLLPAGAELVVNPDPASPMFASVRSGVSALLGSPGPVCIHPVDVFAISVELVVMLHDAWRREPKKIHKPRVGDRGGHPLIIPPGLVAGVLAVSETETLKDWVRGHAAHVVQHVWHDERLLEDIDTPADYARCRPPAGATDSG